MKDKIHKCFLGKDCIYDDIWGFKCNMLSPIEFRYSIFDTRNLEEKEKEFMSLWIKEDKKCQ